MLPQLLKPVGQVGEGVVVRDVIDQESPDCLAVVAFSDRTISLATS